MDSAATLGNRTSLGMSRAISGLCFCLLFLMSAYMYLKVLWPSIPLVKDVLILISVLFLIFQILLSGRFIRFHLLDHIMLFLSIFLLLQLFYTWYLVGDLFASYYGFRLTFLSLLLYFPFRYVLNLNANLSERLRSLILWILALGAVASIGEFVLVNFAGIPSQVFFDLVATSPDTKIIFLGSYLRPLGISGAPHLSGIHNLLLCALLLPQILPKERKPRWIYLPLFLLGICALVVSTSRTAWTAFAFVFIIYYLSRVRFLNRIRLVSLLFAYLLICLGVFSFSVLLKSSVFLTYFDFLNLYGDLVREWIGPVLKTNPIIGLGYEVPRSVLPQTSTFPAIFFETQSDIFFVQIFKMLGLLGLLGMLSIFIFIPMFMIWGNCSTNVERSAAAILGVGICFSHYNPLSSPPIAIIVCGLIALLATDIKRSVGTENAMRRERSKPDLLRV